MSPRFFTPAQEQQVIAEYLAGAAMNALAKKYGCYMLTVRNALIRNGIERRDWARSKPSREPTPEQRQEIVAAYMAGETRTALVRRLPFTHLVITAVIEQETGKPARQPRRIGPRHPKWKAGERIVDGYRHINVTLVPDDHPMKSALVTKGRAYYPEHRLVMSAALGRPLTSRETVHHKDLDPLNNALGNLQLRQGKHGKGAVFVCGDCGSHNVIATEIGGHSPR